MLQKDKHWRISDWLEQNYPNKGTRYNFENVLKNWIKCFYGSDSVTNYIGYNLGLVSKEEVSIKLEERINEIEEGIEKYLNELDERDFTDDFKTFLKWVKNEGYAPLYIRGMSSKAKYFFSRHDPRCKISDDDWSDIKRTLIPKSTRAATQDDILEKEQLKIVLQHLSIQGKALALFLLSTGTRIGAAVQLKMRDIKLDSDPPEVNIREEYTKGKVGGRVMWFSYEARDAIIEWHKARLFKRKSGNSLKPYDKNLVFNYNERNYRKVWNNALKRADGKRVPPILAKRDPSTKTRIYVYHSHTLRKFFRTNMGFEGSYQGKAGVPDVIVHGWMGHKGYLEEAYARGNKRMAEIYKENMHVVTVYEVGIDEKARAEAKEAIDRAEKLAKQVTVDGAYIDVVGEQLDAFAGLSEGAKEALSGMEKWNLIINAAANLKADAARSTEEFEMVAKQLLITKKAGKED